MKINMQADLPFEWCATCTARDLEHKKHVLKTADGGNYFTYESITCIHEQMCKEVYDAQIKNARMNETEGCNDEL